MTLDELRRFTVARNFPKPTTLKHAIDRLGFVQADPIRAPARAQDLILRQRVKNYLAGDLERRYESLKIEEDFFVNYGYVADWLHGLMHPRSNSRVPADDVGRPWPAAQIKRANLILEFVRARGSVHPREVDEHFAHGKVTNYWGGSSNATTHLMDAMHYQGFLRVVKREKGIRIYSAREQNRQAVDPNDINKRMDDLVDVLVKIYGPLPAASLSFYVRRLRFAVPQWKDEVQATLKRAKARLQHTHFHVDWYWSTDEEVQGHSLQDTVRFLAPFDPLVHDRWRFERLWGWTYRFEAYTPVQKRKLGYYAMPVLWRDQVIGWVNLSVNNKDFKSDFGYVKKPPSDPSFKRELSLELDRVRTFLKL